MSNIIYNALRTPDGTVIESRSRWDYVTHTDANGKEYMVDGGLDYIRRSIHVDQVDLSVSLDDGHDKVREACTWGTYGKEGKGPLRFVLIKDMSSNHLHAVLDECKGTYPQIRKAMENELEYREEMFHIQNINKATLGE